MKTLYLDCSMGVAGDMLMSALYELVENKDDFLNQMHNLGLPNLEIIPKTTSKCSIFGTHIDVVINGEIESCQSYDCAIKDSHFAIDSKYSTSLNNDCSANDSDCSIKDGACSSRNSKATSTTTDAVHHHSGEKTHLNYGIKEIRHIVSHLNITETVKKNVLEVYDSIASAESLVHNCEIENIHFHELGSLDAIADITGVCILIEMLAPDVIYASKVHVGRGHVKSSHGILPVPAPATLHLLKGVPIYSKEEIIGELATPTGAALLKQFVKKFTCMPSMTVTKIGYGMGAKDFAFANCIRASLGDILCNESSTKTVVELSCNIDDMTGEELGFAMNILMENGALDVYSTPIYMKKWRNANILTVTTLECEVEKFLQLIFKHTTTIGVRKKEFQRFELSRSCETLSTPLGNINKKISCGFEVSKSKLEFDQLAKMAKDNNLSLFEVKCIIEKSLKE